MRLSALLSFFCYLASLQPATSLAATNPTGPAIVTTHSSDQIVISGPQPEAALVLIGGAFVKPQQYVKLAETIASTSHGKIAVLVPHFVGDIAAPMFTHAKIEAAISLLTAHGVSDPRSHVFAAGHSHGGIAVQEAPVSMNLGGLIMLASYLPRTLGSSDSIATYPKPILTIGAELDGLTGVNYIARDFISVASQVTKEATIARQKPIVVVRGMNHMQFADGEEHSGDIFPVSISLSDAHQKIAALITNFIADQAKLSDVDGATARQSLDQAVAATSELLNPYVRSELELENLCAQTQKQAVNLDPTAWDEIKMESKIYRHGWSDALFILDKSKVKKINQGFELHLPVLIDDGMNPVDLSKDQSIAPRSLLCKMRTGSMLARETANNISAPDKNCAELNQAVIANALQSITDLDQRSRVAAKFGDPATWQLTALSSDDTDEVKYGPFLIRSHRQATGQGWVGSKFAFTASDDGGWVLDTAELHTADDIRFKLFAGAFYCKIIPPMRVIEWATLFSLKN
ncbi:MAG: hypothetical protein FJ146_10420 [Deltaproteobacteria bacterium]|nr:hypothetical protein [Deltaproteobacteria bacterium]